ncbi:EVE domain-containing protein [Paenibacillus sp. P26]|nr:EVE domain-containing protein [Paenibacillus sp. P26]
MAASSERNNERYWVGVVSRSHVLRGVEGGFAQLCHGKAATLRRMKQGDWLIYYSPKTDYKQGEPLQAFTAVGQVTDGLVYEFEMAPDFVPYRRNIRFLPCREVPIRPPLGQLSLPKITRIGAIASGPGILKSAGRTSA